MHNRLSPLSESPRYEAFIKQRDTALDDMLYKHLNVFDRALDRLKERVASQYALMSVQIPNPTPFFLKKLADEFEKRIAHEMAEIETVLTVTIHRLRSNVFTISMAAEAEAIGRATGKTARYKIDKDLIAKQRRNQMASGGTVEQRVWIALERLKQKILDAYRMAIMLEESPQETLERLMKAFPPTTTLRRPRRVLKHPSLKERDRPLDVDVPEPQALGVIDPEAWDQAVDDYLAEEVPFYVGRSARVADDFYNEHERYQWELEQEVTHDFVAQVRSGSIDAARENGITDFMWVAVIDARTDECCRVRDGLSTTEIEKRLADGKIDEGDCEAVVPPAHFNCRCRVSPMADLPSDTPPDFGSFDEWLDSRANS